ncbi:hypothetical protein SGRI78S_04069 [Streptomyces griseus subsp. griseus]
MPSGSAGPSSLGLSFDREVPRPVGRPRSAERVLFAVHDERGVLFQPDALLEPPEAGVRRVFGGVRRQVGEVLPGQLLGHHPGEPAAPEADHDHERDDGQNGHPGEHGDHVEDVRAGAGVAVGPEGVGVGRVGRGRVVRIGALVRVVVPEQAGDGAREDQGDPEDQQPPPVPAQEEGRDPPEDGRVPAGPPDPVRRGQQKARQEQRPEEAPGEDRGHQPDAQDGRRPPAFGAAGAQGVGEDPGGVEAGRRGDDPVLLDVQLVDDRVPVAVVQMGPGAEESGRLARGGVDGRFPEQIVLAPRRPRHGTPGHRLLFSLWRFPPPRPRGRTETGRGTGGEDRKEPTLAAPGRLGQAIVGQLRTDGKTRKRPRGGCRRGRSGFRGADQIRPSSRTASRSSVSSLTDASMRVRENSLMSRPWTISYFPSFVVTGKEEMMPSGTP